VSIALDILKSIPRKKMQKTCKYGGHPWIPENIYYHASGNACRLCKAEREKKYRENRKAA
jgi:hypothetical protein